MTGDDVRSIMVGGDGGGIQETVFCADFGLATFCETHPSPPFIYTLKPPIIAQNALPGPSMPGDYHALPHQAPPCQALLDQSILGPGRSGGVCQGLPGPGGAW